VIKNTLETNEAAALANEFRGLGNGKLAMVGFFFAIRFRRRCRHGSEKGWKGQLSRALYGADRGGTGGSFATQSNWPGRMKLGITLNDHRRLTKSVSSSPVALQSDSQERSLSVRRWARSRALRRASIADSVLAGFGAGVFLTVAVKSAAVNFFMAATGAVAVRAGLRRLP